MTFSCIYYSNFIEFHYHLIHTCMEQNSQLWRGMQSCCINPGECNGTQCMEWKLHICNALLWIRIKMRFTWMEWKKIFLKEFANIKMHWNESVSYESESNSLYVYAAKLDLFYKIWSYSIILNFTTLSRIPFYPN